MRRLGIVTRDEEALPVGEKATHADFDGWVCPHVMGGIPAEAVDAEFKMARDGPSFTGIDGLTDMPRRIFKLATSEEASSFKDSGRILSTLDKTDGFVHLSDRTSPPKVARLFFKGCKDLKLIELDAEKLESPVHWILGKMGDSPPDAETKTLATTVVHCLMPDGCVHVYGDAGVTTNAIIREESIPLGDDGNHVFPAWM